MNITFDTKRKFIDINLNSGDENHAAFMIEELEDIIAEARKRFNQP
jgi:hypothetical protein